jgi:hypothetical protein
MLLQDFDNQTLIGELRPGTCDPVSIFFSQKQLQISVGSLSSADLGLLKTAGSGVRRLAGLSSKKAETNVESTACRF